VGIAAALVLAAAGCGGDGDDEAATQPSSSNQDWTPVYKDGVLQPLPDGFPENPITLVNADEPSHDDGIYARAMQSGLKDISPVALEVRDMSFPQFGTWAGIQFMEDQPGGSDGDYVQVTAMTGAALDFLTEPIEEEFGMTLDSLRPIIATELTPFVMITRDDAPWATYEEMVAEAKAHPGTLRYVASSGSRLDIDTRKIMKAGGWDAKIIPMGSSSEAATVVASGEGDFTMLTPSVALAHTQAGKARIILVTSNDEEPPSQWSDATTTKAIGMPEEPWGTIRGFTVPAAVPQAHRDWLFELFKAGSETPAHDERIASVPGATKIVSNEAELTEVMTTALTSSEGIIRELGLHHDQN
jgi:tripartite-type tricarboxylate transporter receptor subunit TctC